MDPRLLAWMGGSEPDGSRPTYSAGGLSRTLSQPYNQSAGIVRPTKDLGFNPGEVDPLLSAQLQMGDRGGIQRGATGFLGAGFNPWTMEVGPSEGEMRAPANQDANIDNLFGLAGALGLDTSGYSRDATPMGIRGERSGNQDVAALYDAVNDAAKDYFSVDHMSEDGKNMERTMYQQVGDQLVPVSGTQRRSGRQDSAFFDDEFKNMVMTIGPAVLGGFMAAPAAGAGQAAGTAGSAAATSATSSIPWEQIGRRALTGALQGGAQSALTGGNILQGALTGGLGGAVSGAGIPSGVLNIGKRVLTGGMGMDSGGSGGAGSAPAASGSSALIGALGGSSGVGGSSGGAVGQLFNPDDSRQRYLMNALRLNRSAKAGDQTQDRAAALQKALEELAR